MLRLLRKKRNLSIFILLVLTNSLIVLCYGKTSAEYLITGSAESDEMLMHDDGHENSYYYLGHPTGVAIHPQNVMQKPPSQLPEDVKSDDKVTDILHGLLLKYDNRIRPNLPDRPTLIELSSVALQIVDIDEFKSELSSTVLLTQSWSDPRLAYESLDDLPFITVTHEHAKDLWLPDTIFINEKEMFVTNDAVVIFRNGSVSRSTRIILTTHCHFNYKQFPFDAQQCELMIGSHAYGDTDVKYAWDRALAKGMTNRAGIAGNIISDIHTGRFLTTKATFNATSHIFKIGKKTSLLLQITLQRTWRPFITRFYLPMVLFVFVSIGTLFIRDEKVALIVNLFNLAFINIFTALRSASDDTPKTSAKTALDQYFIICLIYVLLVVVIKIYKLVKNKQKKCQVAPMNSSVSVLHQGQDSFFHTERRSQSRRRNPDQLDIFNPTNSSRPEADQFANGQGNEPENHSDEPESHFQQIYRSPSYPLHLSSRSRIIMRKTKKVWFWFGKYFKWILLAAFLTTDYIYFQVHT